MSCSGNDFRRTGEMPDHRPFSYNILGRTAGERLESAYQALHWCGISKTSTPEDAAEIRRVIDELRAEALGGAK